MEKQASLTQRLPEPEKKTLYETYTDYIDPSAITVSHYLSRKFYPGQETYIDKIKEWVEAEGQPNKPLVFKTNPGVGIKTILSRWYSQTMAENSSKKYKTLPILHFASNGGNSSNYFYCLYRIVIKLREALKIKQGVDLLEEKIRKYFAYWLDTCSTEIDKQQVLLSTHEVYSKIVIVIEGVDRFTDLETGKEANIAFWLPETFPKNIKVICTVGEASESLEYFEKKECHIEQVYTSHTLINDMLEGSLARETILDPRTEQALKRSLKNSCQCLLQSSDVYKFIQIFSDFLLIEPCLTKCREITEYLRETISKRADLQALARIKSVGQLYDFIIGLYAETVPFKKRLSEVLMYFVLSQKGITIKEIIQLTKFSEQEWALFSTIFAPVLIKHQSIYSIKCGSFLESVMRKDRGAKENKEAHLIKYHQKIAQALENTPNSIRKLEEETYHLFVSKSYFKLKQIVSSIQNFLLMFNPNNKYELSRYWQKLEEKGFDPVIEYNKAVEGFSMHYHPSDENIFKIIIQISRFLKEFSDFETYETPAFRHPLIEGNMAELQTIGLLGEFTELEIYVDNSFSQLDEPQSIPNRSLEEQVRQVREQYFPNPKPVEEPDLTPQIIKTAMENPTALYIEKPPKKIKKKTDTKILSDIESLKVDVPMDREKFRNFYLNSLQEYMKEDDYNSNKEDEGFFQVQDDNIASDGKKVGKNKAEFSVNRIKENYRMRHIKPSLYYYKRWIWIQFPWVCISLNSNYSNAPQFCKQLECEDIDSYEQEAKYTKQALIVAIEAKEKKKMMFTKKSDQFNGYGTGFGSRMKNQTNFSNGKFSVTRNVDKSSVRSRVLQKAFSNTDLNLNALTKQLETRKKNMPGQYKNELQAPNQSQEGIFLSEINENCQQDMKFINERKHFLAPETGNLPSNEILPKLKWTIKDHTNYEIAYIKGHIEEKKKKLNKIMFENKKLAESYKELKLKENMTKKNICEQESDKNTRKTKLLDEYSQKKEEAINQFCKSLLQKQRLKIILKLCAQNKTRNEKYLTSLNYFLQNLKKMIGWQKNNIKQITAEMNGLKAMKQKKEILEAEKQRNAKIVQKEVKNYLEEKDKLEMQIENISVVIAEDLRDQKDRLENNLEGHLKNREEKTMLMIQEKKTKQLEEKLKNLQEEYEALKQLFEIDGTDFENSPKFQHLLQQNEKNKKLKIIYFQRKNKLQQLQKEREKALQQSQKSKSALQTFQKSRLAQTDKRSFALQIHGHQKYSQAQSKNINNLKILLSNIALKLGVKRNEDIVPLLRAKLEEFRQRDPERYRQIMAGAGEAKGVGMGMA